MSDPWQILGLSRESATEKEVKSAYARLIKQHRPDTDPEGFQRVRQAYEAALAMLKGRGAERPEILPIPMPLAPAPAEREDGAAPCAPPELAEAELAVYKARDEEGPAAMNKAMAGLYPLCRCLRPGKAGFELWYECLHRVTEGRSAVVARGVTIPQLIDEMESGGTLITQAVVAHWEAMRNTERLHALAEAMVAHAERLGNRESAVVALRLAIETGFVYPDLSSTLLTFAFPHVDRAAREQLVPQAEEQASIGSLMAGLRSDQITFWHERVRNPDREWDWNNKASQDALQYLATKAPSQWKGLGIVRQIVPAEWFARLEQETSRRPQPGSVPPPLPLTKTRLKSSGTGMPWGRSTWLIVFVVINAARLLSHCTGPNHSLYPAMPPSLGSHEGPLGLKIPE